MCHFNLTFKCLFLLSSKQKISPLGEGLRWKRISRIATADVVSTANNLGENKTRNSIRNNENNENQRSYCWHRHHMTLRRALWDKFMQTLSSKWTKKMKWIHLRDSVKVLTQAELTTHSIPFNSVKFNAISVYMWRYNVHFAYIL